MEFRHEIINFNENLPMRIYVHKIGDVSPHWHQSIELLIVINGEVDVIASGQCYHLKSEDVILINSNEQHSLHGTNATMIAVQLKMSLLSNVSEDIISSTLDCVSSGNSGDARFEKIKNLVATMLKINIEGGKNISLFNYSLCYSLIYELFGSFDKKEIVPRKINHDRMNEILQIINTNYKESLSLEYIASCVYLSVPYLSKMFKQAMGITVSEYIRNIRIFHAKQELLTSCKPISQISDDNGFPNQRAFAAAFKETEGETPAVWRKKNAAARSRNSGLQTAYSYYSTDGEVLQNDISEFITRHTQREIAATPVSQNDIAVETVNIDSQNRTGKFSGAFKTYIGVSSAKELLFDSIREQLTLVQQTIGFRYVKVHGIFEDSLMIYNEDSNHNPFYNFSIIDSIFDFLISIHLKPLLQLSFMPKQLAASKEKTVFLSDMIICYPNSMEKWKNLVSTFLRHLVDRYSLAEVKTWPISVWNEPSNLPVFGFADYSEFYRLYCETYRTVKSIHPDFLFYGPSEFLSQNASFDCLTNFLVRAKADNCLPDFISVHYYDTDAAASYYIGESGTFHIGLNASPDGLSTFIRNTKKELTALGLSDVPLHIIEWNATTSHRDLLSDTCFKSCYIVKNLIECSNQVDAMGYWLLSDFHFESTLPEKIFHGGLGMFTTSGGIKPAYYAYAFLNELYETIVSQGEDYIVTSNGSELAIVMFNYSHFSEAYAKEVGINVNYTSRYTVFPHAAKKRITMNIRVPNSKYKISQSLVNRENGSIFDKYLEMGLIEPLDSNEIKWLNYYSNPKYNVTLAEIQDNHLQLDFELQPFEIRLIKVKAYE